MGALRGADSHQTIELRDIVSVRFDLPLNRPGSVIADLQARLFRAVQGNDLAEAKRLNDRIEPLMRVFYADPFVDMHNRMKKCWCSSANFRAQWCARRW